MHTIEWQKQGILHVHISLCLDDRIMLTNIDKVICVEIPDLDSELALHNIITKTRITALVETST